MHYHMSRIMEQCDDDMLVRAAAALNTFIGHFPEIQSTLEDDPCQWYSCSAIWFACQLPKWAATSPNAEGLAWLQVWLHHR